MLPPPRRSRALVAALALAAAPLAAATGEWHEGESAKVRWISRWAAVAPGTDAGLGLEFALAPGWHVYWKNPGDAGYPPAVELRPGALGAAELRFPAPRRFPLAGGLESIGYEREVVFPVAATALGTAGESLAVAATVDYLLCAESCVPYRHALALALPLAERSLVDPEVAPRLDAWRERLPRPLDGAAGERVQSRLARAADGAAFELELELELAAPGAAALAPDLFFDEAREWIVERPLVEPRPEGLAAYRVLLRPRDPTRPPPAALRLVWTASGFARAGRPLAWTGGLDLATLVDPEPRARPWIAPAIVATLVLVWLALRRRSAAPR